MRPDKLLVSEQEHSARYREIGEALREKITVVNALHIRRWYGFPAKDDVVHHKWAWVLGSREEGNIPYPVSFVRVSARLLAMDRDSELLTR
jgi:hypothetical protein